MAKDVIKLLSQQELQEGLRGRSAKQASALLHLIETRTAHLLADSHRASIPSLAVPTRTMQAHAYLQTLAQARAPLVPPTIRDLERYAQEWAVLVPATPSLRAMTAHLLGTKYRLPMGPTPGIHAALGLEEPAVQASYQQRYQRPIHDLYSNDLSLAERLGWIWTRLAGWLENLSPFWSAFGITLTETVGAGILALPITLAQVGPLAGAVFLLVFGLINMLTLAGVSEAVTRDGPMRYGYAFLGQLIGNALGPASAVAFALALWLICVGILSSYYIGVATTLADATGLSPLIWAALLFLIACYFLQRKSLDSTIASSLVIGLVNITLILILSALAWPYIELENLRYVRIPGFNGEPFDPKLVELTFGVILGAYFGHTSVGNVAKVVLRRDPSGRTLLWGNMAALTTAMLLYIYWVTVVNGAIAPATLAASSGTALAPLAMRVGPAVHLFGSIFVILGMGMASIHYSLALFNQVQEWLPIPLSARTALSPNGSTSRSANWLFGGPRRHFWWSILPVLLIFLLVEWILYTNQASFAAPLGVMSTLAAPLLAGIFPVLLVAIGRRKGDYIPAVAWRWLGHPVVLFLLYGFFFAGLLAHGLIIWPDPVRRTAALLVCVGILVLTWVAIRRGALQSRTVLEVRFDQTSGGRGAYQVVSAGQPLAVTIDIDALNQQTTLQTSSGDLANLASMRSLHFHLPASKSKEIKVWLHQISSSAESIGVPALCSIATASQTQEVAITAAQPAVVLPLPGTAQPVAVRIQFMSTLSQK